MTPVLRRIDPARLQIREGGGCLSLFGFPFFAAGIFLLLLPLGVIPIGNAEEMTAVRWIAVFLMGIAFTAVGGALTFGRIWTTIDAGQRLIVQQKGLLVPMRSVTHRAGDYTAVAIHLEKGDSDSFPVLLKARAGADLRLCQSNSYSESWTHAVTIAEHLHFELEDTSSDHTTRLAAHEAKVPLRDRLRNDDLATVPRPPAARADVSYDNGGVRIVIPRRQYHPALFTLFLIPVIGVAVFIPPALQFFRQTNTPDAVGWVILGVLIVVFGLLPVSSALTNYLRMRRSRTIVTASPEGITVEERGIWRTTPRAVLSAAEIIDIDFSTGESLSAWAKRSGLDKVRQAGRSVSPESPIGPRTERILSALSKAAKGQGIVVKSRQGWTTIGRGLEDDEIRYLHAVIKQALVGRWGGGW